MISNNSVQALLSGSAVSHPDFIGVGFHAFFPAHIEWTDETLRNEVLWKRWREFRPSFVRANHHFLKESYERDEPRLAALRDNLLFMQRLGARTYVTTWHPPVTEAGPERDALATAVAEDLAYLCDAGVNVEWYCMTNELTLTEWGSMLYDLQTFYDHHRRYRAALDARGLQRIGLLSTDAAPVQCWGTIQKASDDIPELSAAYGGHHYWRLDPEDPHAYPTLREDIGKYTPIAHRENKPFIVGEFGLNNPLKEEKLSKEGFEVWESSSTFDSPKEPFGGTALAEFIIAGLDSGVHAMGNWCFFDFPDEYARRIAFKWGMCRWSGRGPFRDRDYSVRAHYSPIAWFTREFRGPGRILALETGDSLVRAVGVEHSEGSWAAAFVNRNPETTRVCLRIESLPAEPARFHVYDPANPPRCEFGDLPGPPDVTRPTDGVYDLSLPANGVGVLTTAFESEPPEPVWNVRLDDRLLRWETTCDDSVAYYRIFQDGVQIGSTMATEFEVTPAPASSYSVLAVDDWLNVSTAEEAPRS